MIFNYNNITWTTGTASAGNATGLGGTPAQVFANLEHGNSTILVKCILSNVKCCIVEIRLHECSGDVK